MKRLLVKLIPGAAATVIAMALCGIFSNAQQTNNAPAPAKYPPPAVSVPAAPLDQVPVQYQQQPAQVRYVTICGACGAEIEQPRAVMVAAPVYRQQGSFYGIPPVGFIGNRCDYDLDECEQRIAPQPVFGLSEQWRARPHARHYTQRY
jgi:hypothetical protein